MSFRLQTLIIIFIAAVIVALLVVPGRIPNNTENQDQILFSSHDSAINPKDSGGVELNDIVSGLNNEFAAEFDKAQDEGFEINELLGDIENEAGDYGQPINANNL